VLQGALCAVDAECSYIAGCAVKGRRKPKKEVGCGKWKAKAACVAACRGQLGLRGFRTPPRELDPGRTGSTLST
jgi:hypothetical protein